jgi:uncharacterized membrane protein
MAPRAKATKTRERELSMWAWIAQHARAQVRFLVALGLGIAVALLVPITDVVPRVLAGWNAGGWLYLILIGIKMGTAEIDGIKRQSTLERESRIVVLVVVIFGSIFTTLALFAQLMAMKSEQGFNRDVSLGLSISTIFLSWLLIHTVFAVYYAHEFHSEGRARGGGTGGGLKFPDDRTPDYLDFLYFSFVVGTTAQTSDVDVCSRAMRRMVMLHGILSFFYNTAVIALTVNLAAQLVQG